MKSFCLQEEGCVDIQPIVNQCCELFRQDLLWLRYLHDCIFTHLTGFGFSLLLGITFISYECHIFDLNYKFN